MTRGLLIIDIQRDYFPGGAFPLIGADDAAAQAGRLLAAFRASAKPVVHLQHEWDAPDAAFMRPGTPGIEIHPRVAPAPGETVITKTEPNGFHQTPLEDALRDGGVTHLVVAGMMSSMCVDSTVRRAAELGFDVSVAADACAAPDLDFATTSVPGAVVHATFMAALADGFATVADCDQLLSSGASV
jgi:nicotinamidase-related amidase